jgi:hypothetical protein
MLSSRFGQLLAILAGVILLSVPVFAFDSPLSSESVREAYFLGQRRDESMTRLLDAYTKYLAPPKTGPYISSVQFLTPFAQLVRASSQRSVGYSAQQAEQEHRGQEESVEIAVAILLTDTYPAYFAGPSASRSGAPIGYRLRFPGFWRDFQVQIFQRDNGIEPLHFTGQPNYLCSYEGGCRLTGATIWLDFPAKEIVSDTITVEVDPPQGDPIAVDFDLTRLR